MNDISEKIENNEDKLSKLFFFALPWTVPFIVTFLTYPFYMFLANPNMIWLPLIIIYWGTIWIYTLSYRKMKGGVFYKERFKPTLKLKGKYLWFQYFVTYGPLIYSIPLFIINYALDPNISVTMYILFTITAIINGPTEEIFWRACLDDAGKNAGISERGRLIFAPIAFSFWHTAFVIHLVPWGPNWWTYYGMILIMTWSSGFIWLWVMHRSERLFPQCIYHASANFLSIFPMMIVSVMNFYF